MRWRRRPGDTSMARSVEEVAEASSSSWCRSPSSRWIADHGRRQLVRRLHVLQPGARGRQIAGGGGGGAPARDGRCRPAAALAALRRRLLLQEACCSRGSAAGGKNWHCWQAGPCWGAGGCGPACDRWAWVLTWTIHTPGCGGAHLQQRRLLDHIPNFPYLTLNLALEIHNTLVERGLLLGTPRRKLALIRSSTATDELHADRLLLLLHLLHHVDLIPAAANEIIQSMHFLHADSLLLHYQRSQGVDVLLQPLLAHHHSSQVRTQLGINMLQLLFQAEREDFAALLVVCLTIHFGVLQRCASFAMCRVLGFTRRPQLEANVFKRSHEALLH
mmetsp:Transcript_937/g.2143  ORF Transcript_937/g.2143 Transcript_937/m.2143 type:complete len:331 (-) Transcript_937:146-1138(-)